MLSLSPLGPKFGFPCVSFACISPRQHRAWKKSGVRHTLRNRCSSRDPRLIIPRKPGHALAGLSCLPERANGQAKGVSSTYWVAARAIPASGRRPPLFGCPVPARRHREPRSTGSARRSQGAPPVYEARPRRDTYLVVRGVGGCEVRLGRTIDLVHNIQTAHGFPQRRRLSVLSSTLGRRRAGMLHGRHLDPSSQVIRGGARGSVLRGSGSRSHAPFPPLQFQSPPRSEMEAPGLQLVGI